METEEIIHRLKSYRNGVHGDFFIKAADRLQQLSQRKPEWKRFLIQRKEEGGWRSIGFSVNNIDAAVDRERKLKERGYATRIVVQEERIINYDSILATSPGQAE